MIYLDNGATSYPKPKEVAEAVYEYMTKVGSNINRGGYEKAYSAAEVVLETRELIDKLMNGYGARNAIFTPGNTYSLNFLIKGLAGKGDKFLTTHVEHNAVYRPLHQLQQDGVIEYDCMPCNELGELELEDALAMITPDVRAVVMLHASNVSGTLLPIEEVGKRCHEQGVIFIVDAAQTAGNTPIDMQKCHIDGLTVPGHKSLLGPQGVGVMLINPEIKDEINPLVSGGTGSHSDMADMPSELPDRFESGTLNLPGIFGLHAALRWLEENFEKVHEHEKALSARMLDGLKDVEEIHLAGLPTVEGRVSVISVDFLNKDNGICAFNLEHEYGISTRVGLHCAPLAHKSLGTFPEGTVRFSIGPFNTEEEIDTAVAAVKILAQTK
ncbi:aminotransferase class V-fold PLP-dependent enzyme [Mogibacterium timidum]|uniref:cysteine desulfurase n=1 Tax=Mogibacterium timidum ATCC 33093 TaxID=1401079 RepID=X8ITD3_9FIRM|nr:aminotransferase class V-fold PLP-dependent enzyme [Mogibacterium timidum]EUC52439.1 cysteine desulfurase family protein [Mogibacterium timidum ATCC 33093]